MEPLLASHCTEIRTVTQWVDPVPLVGNHLPSVRRDLLEPIRDTMIRPDRVVVLTAVDAREIPYFKMTDDGGNHKSATLRYTVASLLPQFIVVDEEED